MVSFYNQNNGSSHSQSPSIPLHLFLFIVTLLLFITLSWYLNYESILESMIDQIKLLLVVSPLVVLLVVRLLSSGSEGRRMVPFFASLPDDRDALHRAGGSPWGVGFLLVLLLLMVSYQSYFQEFLFLKNN
ncbi:uncharacterized protein LOC110020098 [Phalaenopsis equestris]|uniref:uncharacterized protein LOC110020098 n=1 Tax=Phalaenopsis equestris TaxID=78828 RepID=UPI0009E1CCB5|nr:uncharacterized protein LOC110020098 [Phalaenopsis equestris]